jgi:hypothetical protein
MNNKGFTVHFISTRINKGGNVSQADIEEAKAKKAHFKPLAPSDVFAVLSEIDESTSMRVARTIFDDDSIVIIHEKAAADFILERLAQRRLQSVVMVANPEDAKPILQKICEHLMGSGHQKRKDALSKIEVMLGHLLDEGDIELRSLYFPDEDEEDRGFKITAPGNAEIAS